MGVIEITVVFSLAELGQSFLISIALIYSLKLQREIFPRSYFAIGDIIKGFQYAPTVKATLLRITIIFIVGLAGSYLFNEPKIIIFGLTLGSFLIVWPGFVNEENINIRLIDKKFLLYTVFTLFIVITYSVANFSVIFYNFSQDFLFIYLRGLQKERLIAIILDGLIWLAIIGVVNFVASYLS